MNIHIGQRGEIWIDQDNRTYRPVNPEAKYYCYGLTYDELLEGLEAMNLIAICELCDDRWAEKKLNSNRPDCCDECETK